MTQQTAFPKPLSAARAFHHAENRFLIQENRKHIHKYSVEHHHIPKEE